MIIIKGKKTEEQTNIEKQKLKKLLSSKKSVKPLLRACSMMSRDREKKSSNCSNKSKNKNNNNNLLGKLKLSKNYNDEYVKDIKLNLDKYIFNYDESILKHIKVKDNYKDKYNEDFIKKNNPISENVIKNNISKKNTAFLNYDKKLEIEIGTIRLFWTNQDALTKSIILNKKESEYLLDNPPFQWKYFVEKNIKNILAEESNIIKPSRRSSKLNFQWKDFITKKEQ